MVCNTQEVGLSELIVSPGLKAYEYMNKSRECLFSCSPPACKNLMQQEEREIRDGQWKRHRKMKGVRDSWEGVAVAGARGNICFGAGSAPQPAGPGRRCKMGAQGIGRCSITPHLLMPLHGRRNPTAKYSPLGGLGLRNPRK